MWCQHNRKNSLVVICIWELSLLERMDLGFNNMIKCSGCSQKPSFEVPQFGGIILSESWSFFPLSTIVVTSSSVRHHCPLVDVLSHTPCPFGLTYRMISATDGGAKNDVGSFA